MKQLSYFLIVVFGTLSAAVHAVPTSAPLETVEAVYVPFDPPLGQPLRYRWEKVESKDGKTEVDWSVASHVFEKQGDGFKLTVTPISSGSNETDPRKLEIERRLSDLADLPFVLTLSADGAIAGVEKSDFYWNTIISAFQDYAKTASAEEAAGLVAAAKLIGEMPEDVRLGMLTESVQPLLEFGETEWVPEEAIGVDLETASPWGGTFRSKAVVTLGKVVDDVASLSITTTVPREELNSLIKAFSKKLIDLPAEKRSEMNAAIAGLKDFRHETRASYAVSTADGMLHRYQSTETIDVSEAEKSSRKLTTRSLVLEE